MTFTTPLRKVLTWIAAGLVFVMLVAGVIFIFGNIPDSDRVKLLLEVSKFLLQIITLLLIAFLVSKLIKDLESNRRRDKALHDARVAILNELETVFQKITKSQHELRKGGLTEKYGANVKTMNQDQVKTYKEEMDKLNDAELEINKIGLGIERFQSFFTRDVELKGRFKDLKEYLNALSTEYERYQPLLTTNASNLDFSEFKELKDFTGSGPTKYLTTFSVSYANAVSFIREDLLPLKLALQPDEDVIAKALKSGE
ncbi:MAG TPA: hypothetical protein VK582_22685 [Pyrinomonadaceae bacterium]|nr:hypothetical protein [Pyrinomonadaceae bacterium]